MVSRTASTCKHYTAGCTKKQAEILQPQNSEKEKNAPDLGQKGRNWVRFGCWRGWERLETGANGWENPESEPKRTPFPCNTCKKKTGRNPEFPPVLWQGQKDLSRLPPRSVRGRAPLALAHPTTRTARGAAMPRYQDVPPNDKKQRHCKSNGAVFGRGRRT